MKNKIYVIFNLSHDTDDWGYSECVEYISISLEEAINHMRKLSSFCDSQMDNNNWTYHYVLRGFELPYDRIMSGDGEFFTECKNYKDED